jgi:glyoxylase-like metal-dependent hydrolase (beta-lactamase superfamily II)
MPRGGVATEVAQGVYRLGTMWANFYLVAADGEFVLVDSGYPKYWPQVEAVLNELGKPIGALAGAIITHHHVDHAGTGEQARTEAGATVFAHEADTAKVGGEQPSHPPHGFYGQAWRLTMLRYLVHTVRVGGAGYKPVSAVEMIRGHGGELELPGRPRVIFTPGHTAGHCSVVLEERGVLFTGDALVNHDYATGRRGVALHRFNEDRADALRSLDRLEGVASETLLFGHGDPWRGEPQAAVASARERA